MGQIKNIKLHIVTDIKTLVASILKMVDAATKKTLASIPLLKTKAGPRDRDDWPTRLKGSISLSLNMWATTKRRITTGSVSSQTKRGHVGGGSVGTFTIFSSTSST